MTDETKIKESQINDLAHVVKIQKDETDIVSEASTINFSGSGVSVSSGAGVANVTISGGSGGTTVFTGLTDTPSSYTGHAGKSVVVASGETALEFTTISGGSGTDDDAIHDNVANEITAITPKTVPVSADEFVLEDSEATYVKKAVTFGNIQSNLSITESQVSDLAHVVEIQKDGATVVSEASIINFSGSGVSVTSGVGIANVTISGGGGSSTFIELTDTPTTFSGHAGKIPAVNTGEDALEFISLASATSWMETIILRRTTADDLSKDTWHNVDWEAVEQEDWESWESVTNPERIVLDETGIYLVIVQLLWETGTNGRYTRVIRNGNQSLELIQASDYAVSTTHEHRQNYSGIVKASADDYIEVEVYQDSGGNLELRGGAVDAKATRIWVVKLKTRSFTSAANSNVLAYASVAQTGIVTATSTIIELDQEAWDLGSEWNTTTDEFIANNSGYYQVNFSVSFDSWNTTAARILSKIMINSTDAVLFEEYAAVGKYPSAGGSGMIYLDAEDVVEFEVYQDSGVDQDILAGQERTYLNIYRVA